MNQSEQLSNELIYQRYLVERDHIQKLFTELKLAEYVALGRIIETGGLSKVYLKDLAAEMSMPIATTSRMIHELNDKGLVSWKHEMNGKGTYVSITEGGRKKYAEQARLLKRFTKKVTDRFGIEREKQFLTMLRELESVIAETLEER